MTENFFTQLYAGPEGAPISSLQPLLPITTFRPDLPGYGPGYVWEVDVKIPFLPPDSYGTIVMRAFDGANWESSMRRGESAPARIKIGGGFSPPGLLIGLEGFQVYQVPEPNSLVLLLLGFSAFLHRSFRSRRLLRSSVLMPLQLSVIQGGRAYFPEERRGDHRCTVLDSSDPADETFCTVHQRAHPVSSPEANMDLDRAR